MTKPKSTSIYCSPSLLKDLRELEDFPRETYEEIINRLINCWKEQNKEIKNGN